MGSKRRVIWTGRVALAAVVALGTLCAHGEGVRGNDLEPGRRAYEASDYGRAVQILQEAATKNPRDGEILLLLAKSHFELREFDAAIGSTEKAIALAPDNSIYHEWLGRAYGEKADHSGWLSALGLAKKARQEFETAIGLDKKNFSAFQALIEFDCTAPSIAGGGEDKARREIAQLAALDAAEGHYAAGNCRRQKKDFAAADAEFDQALAGAKSADLIFDVGDYAVKRSEAGRLMAVADAGQRAVPGDVRAKFYQATALILKNEKPEEAERLLREYLKTAPRRTAYPSPAAAHDWLGRLFENENKQDEAAREYESALKLDTKNKIAQDALKKLRKS